MKIIMIDGFKEEYLEYAPYLKSLTKKKQWGRLKMPIGFWGGMYTFFNGKSDVLAFFYRSENSSLKWTKKFSFLGRFIIEVIINLKRLIKREKLFRTGQIPLDKLYKFDTEIKMPLEKIKGVKYSYFGEIDSIAHRFGTKSKEVTGAIKRVDSVISKMDFDIILSDHGMINIKKSISVPETEDCFIDSTMARYWKEKPDFNSKDGIWINGNKKYGDFIFLANPGVLIVPNYWQGNKPVKAMHGYDSKEMDGI